MSIGNNKKNDPFLQAPLTCLLPSLGSLETLYGLKTFIFARFEKVEALRQAAVARGERMPEPVQQEADMLLEVLDWLKMSPVKE